jgi:hypothetical protein
MSSWLRRVFIWMMLGLQLQKLAFQWAQGNAERARWRRALWKGLGEQGVIVCYVGQRSGGFFGVGASGRVGGGTGFLALTRGRADGSVLLECRDLLYRPCRLTSGARLCSCGDGLERTEVSEMAESLSRWCGDGHFSSQVVLCSTVLLRNDGIRNG